MNRRRLVHLLVGINGAGFVFVGTSLAAVFKAGEIPWFGLAACLILFLGVAIPFFREFLALREGFEEVERETRKSLRRRGDEAGSQDVFAAGARPNPFRRVRGQPLLAIFLTALGWSLAALEGFRWLGNL